MPALKPLAYEKGDMLYIVAPVTPHQPTKQEVEEYAFAKSIGELKDAAPNDNIAWFGGHYVEADRANLNGAMWLSDDLAIASLTPMMMPVTVMHDPRTAVGVIADVGLMLPDDKTPRAKIETALALWRHRFPEAVEEAEHNYREGTLMQSMECLAPRYECSECRMPFVKLPGGAEKDMWCAHLKESQPSGGFTASAGGQNANASRILRSVTFTGTGLIFGTRGGVGADPSANLESFQEEVAEFHSQGHRDKGNRNSQRRSKRSMDITIDKAEYDELQKRPSREEYEAAQTRATEAEAKVEQAEAAKVQAETAKKTAEEAKEAAEAKVTQAEEKANRQTLRDQRFEALGNAFTEKLDGMPTTKANLLRDAEEMKEEAWDARLKEVEESSGVKRDAKKDGGKPDPKGGDKGGEGGDNAIFDREEVARFQGGGGIATATREQKPSERRSVVAGLTKPIKKS